MYSKFKQKSSKGKVFVALVLFSVAFGCSEDEISDNVNNGNTITGKRKNASVEFKVNPCSKAIMQKALKDLGRPNELDENRVYHYYQFNPERVTGDMLAIFELDENIQILDFPFADPKIYKEEMEETLENTIEPLKDGNLYAVVKKNSLANNVFEDSELGAIKLNELYLPHEDDTTLMKQALGIALDLSAAPLDSIHSSDFWCGFQKVKGHVRYRDFSTGGGGTVRPVRGMKVFALVFGIPVNTWTNNNGYYQVPWFFLFGTLVGTHAQNSKANIKPLTLNGNFLSNVGNIIVNFILGSRHIEGGFSACRMGNDINIEFHNHDQVRLWAQLIESVHLHHTYCAQDGIMPAPNNMTIYAQWGNSGRPSAPMLGHIQINPVSIMSKILGENLQSSAPNLFNLLFGVLPDMTITVDPNNHTTQGHVNRVETIFHELAHASLFRRVGSIWWTEAIANVVSWGNCPGYYGCIGDVHWGKTQVNESWAAYLGREHHKRLHPNASVQVRLITQQWALKSYTNNQALEEMVYFTENTWFHPGIFHDLRDNYSYLEDQDSLSGYSILSMYNAFNPHTNSLCSWRDQFHSNTLVNLSKLNSLMIKVNEWNQICH